MNIVFVGHVDHGKSTLIGRLFYDTDSLPEGKLKELKEASEALGKELEFGFILDNLEEEREQGITIDTAQKFFKTNKRDYVIIDAPGHVEFVKNMITGASQADAAVLIVDAEEGVQEQTRRHAYILNLLGLNQVIAVVNKMDLINYEENRFNDVKKQITEFLDKINIHPSNIIPISSKEGDNIAKISEKMVWYKEKIFLEALDLLKTKKEKQNQKLVFPIQDVYNFDKRMFVGKIVSGKIKKDQEILILPSKETTKVKTIEIMDKEIEEAVSEQSIGITTQDKLFIDRGNIVLDKNEKMLVTNKIRANIFWLDKEPYKKGERILFRCSTQDSMCEIEEILKKINSSNLEVIKENENQIENREVGEIIIKTEKPIVIDNFNETPELGRFVLERNDTTAGGIIIL